jgi:hypothetical protein
VVPLDVQVSDRILFGKYSGSDIKLDGEEYMIMREDEVLGIPDAKPEVAIALSHSHDLALLGLIFGAVGDVQYKPPCNCSCCSIRLTTIRS